MSSPTRRLTFVERATRGNGLHPLAAYLFKLMTIKQTNLCVSADVNSTTALLQLARDVGDDICVLKTHADIVDDWGERTVRGLQVLAREKGFLIFEDRKFGDIGSTVEQQYVRGPLQIATWAHIVNAHLLPGPGIIAALREGALRAEHRLGRSVSTEIFVGTPEVSEDDGGTDDDDDDEPLTSYASSAKPQYSPASTPTTPLASTAAGRKPTRSNSKDSSSVRATTTIYQTLDPSTLPSSELLGNAADRAHALRKLGEPPINRGLLVFAQMSSAGNRMDGDYTKACVAAAQANTDFVMGYIAQESLNTGADNFISFTPGVLLPREGEEESKRPTGDGKGQQYRTPREVVGEDGCDVVIVGRGIIKARDRRKEAERYRKEAWRAYEQRVKGGG